MDRIMLMVMMYAVDMVVVDPKSSSGKDQRKQIWNDLPTASRR